MALTDTGRIRGFLGTVPIALASSLAVSLNLVAPAQAAPPPTRTTDPAGDTGEATALRRSTITSTTTPSEHVSPAQTTVAAAPANYRVQAGDTVSGIASRFGIST